MSIFKQATKRAAKLRMAIAGPSGSGKTYSALAVGTALGGRVALLDTEHGSASKYADLFRFDAAEMKAPFHPERYIKVIQAAAEAGYEVLIIDSLSHAWAGQGGLLEEVDKVAKRSQSKNGFAAWKEVTPIHQKLIEAMLAAPLHVIATMRSKQEYVIEEDDRGRKSPRKLGMAPVQREGMEYEFDVFGELDQGNNLIISKSRCVELAGQVIHKPGREMADTLRAWLGSGAAALPSGDGAGLDYGTGDPDWEDGARFAQEADEEAVDDVRAPVAGIAGYDTPPALPRRGGRRVHATAEDEQG